MTLWNIRAYVDSEKIWVPDGIWTHDPPWSSIIVIVIVIIIAVVVIVIVIISTLRNEI